MFLPTVAKVLPYINGLTIALQRLFSWFGKLLGIDISKVTGSVGGGSDVISDIADDADNLSDGLAGAKDNAKELKNELMGFDEINKLSDNTSSNKSGSGSGLSGADLGLLDDAFNKSFNEYQAVWDKAFANVENKANQIADKLEKLFEPLKEIVIDFKTGDFKEAGKDTSNLIKGIYNFMADAIDKVDWIGIGNKIGQFLAGLDWVGIFMAAVKLKFNIWKAIAEIWIGSFEEAPLQTALLTAFGFLKYTAIGNLIATNIWSSLKTKLGIMAQTNSIPIAKISLTVALLYLTWKAIKFAKTKLDPIWNEYDLEEIKEASEKVFDDWFGHNPISKSLSDFFILVSDSIVDPEDVINGLKLMWNDIKSGDFKLNIGNLFEFPSVNELKSGFSAMFKDIKNGDFKFNLLGIFEFPSYNEMKSGLTNVWESVKSGVKIFDIFALIDMPSFSEMTGALSRMWQDIKSGNFKLSLFGIISLPSVNELRSALTLLWNDIQSGDFKLKIWKFEFPSFNELKDAFKGTWNAFAGWINDALSLDFDGFSKTFHVMGKKIEIGLPAFDVQLGRLPTYQTGGFPEDGLFMANHSELVGSFANGKTAVANNQEITQGIANAVFPAVYNAVTQAMSNSGGSNVKVYVGERELTDIVVEDINNTIITTGQSPILT